MNTVFKLSSDGSSREMDANDAWGRRRKDKQVLRRRFIEASVQFTVDINSGVESGSYDSQNV